MGNLVLIDRLLSGVLFIWSLSRHSSSFSVAELIAITLAMTNIRSGEANNPLFLASFYIFAFSYISDPFMNIFFPLALGYQADTVLLLIYNFYIGNRTYIYYLIAVSTICVLLQVFAYSFTRRNTRRKIFHFATLLVFLDAPKPIFLVSQHLIYMFIVLMIAGVPDVIFLPFISGKDVGKDVFSHLFLLGGLTYSRPFLKAIEYTKLLITICVMDSFTSISGKFFGARKKSFIGFLCGQIPAYFTEYVLNSTVDIRYHLVMGLIEYCVDVNDNIMLPISAVCYFYYSPAA